MINLHDLVDYKLTEKQFAQIIGRTRIYQHLPKKEKALILNINFTDDHINIIVKDFFEDDSFCRNEQADINLWNVYNLFTQANKSSYIFTLLFLIECKCL